MTQVSPLSDIRTSSPSGLGAILSQAGGINGQTTGTKDLFSSLVSGSEGVETESLSYTWTSTDTGLSTDALAADGSEKSTAMNQVLQGIASLTDVLQKIRALLQSNEKRASEKGSETTEASTSDPTVEPLLDEAPITNDPLALPALEALLGTMKELAQLGSDESVDLIVGADAASADDETEDLSDILMEIIAMMQGIVQTLHQNPPPNALQQTGKTQALTEATATDLTEPLKTVLMTMEEKAEQWLETLKESFASKEAITVASTESPATTLMMDAFAQFKELQETLGEAIAAYQDAVQDVLAAATKTDETSKSSAQSSFVKATEESVAAQAALTSTLVASDKDTTKAVSSNDASKSITAQTAAIEAASPYVSSASNQASNDTTSDSADDDTTSALENALETGLLAEESSATGSFGFAAHLSAIKSAHEGSAGLPSIAEQVILTMSRNVKNGQNQMTLQLQPSELGTITVKLKFMEGDKVQGTITADNPKTLDLLQKDARALERALQNAGLNADSGSLEFGLSGRGNQDQAEQAGEENSSEQNGEDGSVLANGSEDGRLIDGQTTTEAYYVTPTGVNIRV